MARSNRSVRTIDGATTTDNEQATTTATDAAADGAIDSASLEDATVDTDVKGKNDTDADAKGNAVVERTTRCPECSGKLRQTTHETVCQRCGLIVNDQEIDRGPEWREFDDGTGSTMKRCNDGGLNRTHHDSGLGSEIGYSSDHEKRNLHRLRTHNRRARFVNNGSRSKAKGNGAIQRVVAALDLPSDAAERACQLYKQAQNNDLLLGHNVEGFVGASIYAACREMELGRLPEDIGEAIQLSAGDLDGGVTPTDEVQSTYSLLCRELGLTPRPPLPSDYVPRLASGVELGRETNALALELAQACDGHTAIAGRSPSGVAAACVYAAVTTTNEALTQRAVAQEIGVAPVTVRKSTTKIKQVDAVASLIADVTRRQMVDELDLSAQALEAAADLSETIDERSTLFIEAPARRAAACVALAVEATGARVKGSELAEAAGTTVEALRDAVEQIKKVNGDAVGNTLLKYGIIPAAVVTQPPSSPSNSASHTYGGVSAD